MEDNVEMLGRIATAAAESPGARRVEDPPAGTGRVQQPTALTTPSLAFARQARSMLWS